VVRQIGAFADRLVLETNPAVQACRRMRLSGEAHMNANVADRLNDRRRLRAQRQRHAGPSALPGDPTLSPLLSNACCCVARPRGWRNGVMFAKDATKRFIECFPCKKVNRI
jgi:hypothetical protein